MSSPNAYELVVVVGAGVDGVDVDVENRCSCEH